MCVDCRTVKDKRDLVRIVRTPEKQVIVDFTGKANGRGLYLCSSSTCRDIGLNKERLSHALKVSLSSEDVEALKHTLQTEPQN